MLRFVPALQVKQNQPGQEPFLADSVHSALLPSAVGLIGHMAHTALLKSSMLNEVIGLVYVSTSSQVPWRSSVALFAIINDTEKQ